MGVSLKFLTLELILSVSVLNTIYSYKNNIANIEFEQKVVRSKLRDKSLIRTINSFFSCVSIY